MCLNNIHGTSHENIFVFIFGRPKSIFWGIYFGGLVLSNLLENIDQYSIAQSLFKNFGAWKLPDQWKLFYDFFAFFVFMNRATVCFVDWTTSVMEHKLEVGSDLFDDKNCCNYLHASRKVILRNMEILNIFDKKNIWYIWREKLLQLLACEKSHCDEYGDIWNESIVFKLLFKFYHV